MSDTSTIPPQPARVPLAVPILPQEQIAHAMHALAMMEVLEFHQYLLTALTKPLGDQRANALMLGRSKLQAMGERLERLIAENTKLVVSQ